jgi:hypothetical protein
MLATNQARKLETESLLTYRKAERSRWTSQAPIWTNVPYLFHALTRVHVRITPCVRASGIGYIARDSVGAKCHVNSVSRGANVLPEAIYTVSETIAVHAGTSIGNVIQPSAENVVYWKC